MPLPTTAFDPAKTVTVRKTFATFIPVINGTPGTATTLVGKMLDYDNKFETKTRDVPDADGYLRADRTIVTKRDQIFKFETEDVKAVPAIFGGTTLEGAFISGTVELFVVDPNDAAGKCSIHATAVGGSTGFKASWQVDGGMKFAIGEFAKTTISITALEKAILTPDATIT